MGDLGCLATDTGAGGRIDAVLFDLDGVLVDAREWHYEALNRALGLFGHQIDRYRHLTTLDGLPTREKLEYLSVTEGLPRRLHAPINALKQDFTKELIAVHCHPVFAIERCVAGLRRDGHRLAVCSNSVRETLDLMLARSGILHQFDLTLSNQDVGRPKPDPEIYLEAARRLGVDPADCLVVEDNQHGIAAATAAGMHVLAVADPSGVTLEAVRGRIAAIAGGAA